MMKSLRNKFKGRYFRKGLIYFLSWCLVVNTFLPAALAEVVLQTGGVINGSITVDPLGGGTTQSMAASNGAIGHFSDFDIAAGHTVTCLQPGSNANALFRVFSGDGTQILGQFNANGNIFLIDPAGILFGADSVVNVNQLIASSLDISNEDFLAGQYEFFAGDGDIGAIVNDGTINAAQGAALIGRHVLNAGTITTAEGGFVVMAAGDRVLLGEPGSQILVEMNSVALPEDGDGDVVNDGHITAPSGIVVLASGDVFASALELPKVSGGNGRVEQNGHIHVNGATDDGGNVSLTAADEVILTSGSETTANARANGNGGHVVVYSPDNAIFQDGARVEAMGGSESGDGGFFELSGKKYVEVVGDIDLTAANGKSGMFLIDPLDLWIVDSDTANGDVIEDPPGTWKPTNEDSVSELDIDTLEDYLTTTNVTLSTWGTPDAEGQNGDIIFDADRYVYTPEGVDNSLFVKAERNIEFTAGDGIEFDGNGHVELYAGPYGSVTSVDRGKNPPNISTMKGDIIIEAGSGGIDLGVLQAGHESLSGVERPGEIRVQTFNNEPGTIAPDGEYDITLQHANVEGKGYGSIYISSAGNLTINGSTSLGGAAQSKAVTTADGEDSLSFVCLAAEKNVTINGDVYARAHGAGESIASVWIGAGTHFENPDEGYYGTVTVNGNVEADASASGSVKSDATIRIYGSTINLNGSKDPHAWTQTVEYTSDVTGYVDSDDAVYEKIDPENPDPIDPLVDILVSGSRALVDIDTEKDATCLDCANIIRIILPVAVLDEWEGSKNIAITVEVLFNDKESASAAEGSLIDGMVFLDDFTSTNGGTLTLINDSTEVQYTPPEGWEDDFVDGTYEDTFYYYAVDSDGDISEDPALVTVTLTNTAPDAVDDLYTDVRHNLELDVDDIAGVILGIGTDTDLDNQGDPYDPITNPDGWLFQDDLDVVSYTQPTYGTVSFDEETGAFIYTPDEILMRTNTSLEADTFSYTISDGFGGTDTATVTIELTNQVPVANPDIYDVDPDTPLIIPVDQGTIEGLQPAYKDFDPDNESPDRLFDDDLTAVLVNGGTTTMGGTVTLNPDGSFTYTPSANFSGADSFTYYVTDGYGNSESVRVTMYVGSVPYVPPAPGLQREVIEVSGCPGLIQWVAAELGTDQKTVQIWVAKALASPGNIQPCDACEDLKEAATVLQDADGTRVAALAEVINEFASSDAPPTEEQMASIANAIANDIEGNIQYAAAGEYLDALAKYVGVLGEMGFTTDEAVQFATNNYVDDLVEAENVGVAAYVAARLTALGGSE